MTKFFSQLPPSTGKGIRSSGVDVEGCASGSVDTRLLEDGDRKVAHDDVDVKVAVDRDVGGKVTVDAGNYGRFAYGLFAYS